MDHLLASLPTAEDLAVLPSLEMVLLDLDRSSGADFVLESEILQHPGGVGRYLYASPDLDAFPSDICLVCGLV